MQMGCEITALTQPNRERIARAATAEPER